MELTKPDKVLLVDIARRAMAGAVSGKPYKPVLTDMTPVLKQKAGAFVTIEQNGKLRGCVGYIEAKESLFQTVHDAAIAASMYDDRFVPVKLQEIEHLELEISVLSPFEKLKTIEDIVIGKHGLYIQSGYRTGLLLPQVAVEHQWSVTTFLEQTCRKAGLPSDVWQSPKTKIEIFSAIIFNERELLETL